KGALEKERKRFLCLGVVIQRNLTLGYQLKMQQCQWLKAGKKEACNKNAENQYCAKHKYQIKAGRKIKIPCKKCGAGTSSYTKYCSKCGANAIRAQVSRQKKC